MKKFSIIIPVYKNEKNIPVTVPYIVEHLDLFKDYEVELVMVCDGSPDNSYEIMKEYQAKYPELIKIACFTRNFGQGAAIHCGLEMATGDVMGVISCDLQDPFEFFVDMLKEWENGYKFVIASRKDRKDSGISAKGSELFHKLVHKFVNTRYPKGGFDFYLMDRQMAEEFCRCDKPNGSVQMLLLWLGYEYKELKYVRQKREVGKSSWNFSRKIEASVGLLTTYSTILLRSFWGLGIILLFLGFGGIAFSVLWMISARASGMEMILLSFGSLFTGLVLLACGTLGEYIWRAFDLLKGRPRFVVREKRDGIDEGR